MSDQLSISNLLSLLQVDHNSQAIQLAVDSGRLVRQRCYDEAMKTAESAVRLAQYDYTLHGVTLLYQSHARLASHQPRYEQLAVRDCDRAVRNLSLTPFNQAIAQLIRGQVELQCKDHDCQAAALPYFNKAAMLLQKLAQNEHERNHVQQAEYCRQLHTLVSKQIAELSLEITTVPRIEIAEKQEAPVPPATPFVPPISVEQPVPRQADQPVPTAHAETASEQLVPDTPPLRAVPRRVRLVWPAPEPIGMEFAPITGMAAPDYVEVSQIAIHDQPYRIEPITPTVSNRSAFRLRAHQPYLVVPLHDQNYGHYALVRPQPRPEQSHQFIAVDDPATHDTWIDEAEFTEPYTRIHIVGADREWMIHDGTETDPYQPDELRIIGIVEAILTLID